MRMHRLIPMLPVQSMPASVEFYGKLGFIVEKRNDEWGWAMMRCDECRVMLDQSIDLHSGLPNRREPGHASQPGSSFSSRRASSIQSRCSRW